jgi:hypothetical protein
MSHCTPTRGMGCCSAARTFAARDGPWHALLRRVDAVPLLAYLPHVNFQCTPIRGMECCSAACPSAARNGPWHAFLRRADTVPLLVYLLHVNFQCTPIRGMECYSAACPSAAHDVLLHAQMAIPPCVLAHLPLGCSPCDPNPSVLQNDELHLQHGSPAIPSQAPVQTET